MLSSRVTLPGWRRINRPKTSSGQFRHVFLDLIPASAEVIERLYRLNTCRHVAFPNVDLVE